MKKWQVGTGLAVAAIVSCAGLALAAVPHAGHDDADASKHAIEHLSTKLQQLGRLLEKEMNVAESVEKARESLALDETKANDLAAFLTRFRDMKASHDDHEAHRDLAALIQNARQTVGEDGAAWLEAKHETVEKTAQEMRQLGTEIAALAAAHRGAFAADAEKMRRAAEQAQEEMRAKYLEAIAKLHENGANSADRWRALAERSVDREAIEKLVHDAMKASEAARAEAIEKLLEAGAKHDSTFRHDELVDVARKLASERDAAGSHDEALRELLHAQAARARDLAAEHSHAAEAHAKAAAERQMVHAGAAKDRMVRMEKVEREKALSRKRGEKSDLEAARAEIEALRRQIVELERRVEMLRREGHATPDHGSRRDV